MRSWIVALISAAILIATVLASCRGTVQAWDCAELSGQLLRTILEEYDPTKETAEDISQLYDIPSQEVQIRQGDQYLELRWRKGDASYEIYGEENQWKAATISFDNRRPAAKELIACLGNPEWYLAGYGPMHEVWMLSFEMYFPEHGVVAHSFRFDRRRKLPPVDENIPISELHLTPSGTIETIVSSLYYDAPDVTEAALLRLKPWPGSWQEIEVVEAGSSVN